VINSNIKTSDYRYERKYHIAGRSKYEVESIVKLHPAIFSEIHHRRFVNSIYFDSYNLNSFYENVEGTSDRVKVRVRWYGGLFEYIENPILEIKIKKGLLGKKILIPAKPFHLTENSEISDILNSIECLNEIPMIDFRSLMPSLIIRYSRKYYQSCDKKFRITIDDEQSFYLVQKDNNSFLDSHNDNCSVILELKYDQEFDSVASHITSRLPFRITKNSKYVSGVQRVLQVAT